VRHRRLLLIAAVLLTVATKRRATLPPPPREPLSDVFSASNPRAVESAHLSLDLTVDFDAQILRGSVTHTLSHHGGARQFIVDTNGLDVDAVTADGAAAAWSPDGRRLVFVRGLLGEPRARIYMMNADGSQLEPLTR
jgi:aminopeptidase N